MRFIEAGIEAWDEAGIEAGGRGSPTIQLLFWPMGPLPLAFSAFLYVINDCLLYYELFTICYKL